mgnify:CR=1 FL=1
MRNIPIIAGEIYHIYNRGVEKRNIFMENADYFRFIHDLYEFNNEERVFNLGYHFKPKSIATGLQYIKPRKLLVEILAFALMPNHYHLLIRPKTDTATAEFMKKINGGYAHYFNKKHQRTGVLFQGKFKAVLLESNSHLMHMPFYIHCNPLDLVMPEWREGKLPNTKDALHFLENYRWSSFPDYIGKKNFPSVTSREFLLEMADGEQNYKKNFTKWLSQMDLNFIDDLTFE